MPNEQLLYAARRTSPPALLWVALVCSLIAGIGMKLYWDYQHRIELRVYQQQKQSLLDLRAHYDRLFDQQDMRGMAESEARAIYGIPPAEELIPGEHETYGQIETWSDASAGFTITFSFDADRRLVMYWTSQQSDFKLPPAQADNPFQGLIGSWGMIFASIVGVFWLFGLLAYIFSPGRRAWLSLLIVSAVSLMALCWLMGPDQYLDSDGLAQKEDSGGLIFFLSVTAIVVLFGGFRNRFRDPFACHGCGYCMKSNLSGRCPECGKPVSPKLAKLLLADTAK